MNEYTTVWQGFGALICASVAGLLYSLGGRSVKGIRRFGASFILTAGVNVLFLLRGNWSAWLLLIYPLLTLAFSLGYGADSFGAKFFKRLLYALAVCMSGLLISIVYGGNYWFVFFPHVGIGLWSIYFGMRNPVEAAFEEIMVCTLLNLGLFMYPFVTHS